MDVLKSPPFKFFENSIGLYLAWHPQAISQAWPGLPLAWASYLCLFYFCQKSGCSFGPGTIFHFAHLSADALLFLSTSSIVSCLPLSLPILLLRTLVHAFIILNRLDYCSCLSLGLPSFRLRPLDGVLRTARIIDGVLKFGHVIVNSCGIPFIGFQSASVSFIVSIIAWRCILDVAPAYLSVLSELFVVVLSGSSIASLDLS